ncbi:transglutaminase 5, like isoform X2 [Takifugu rubripes]|uniref:protein-glutamine gamma-glutamyltransferase n=1 Tax=Takifugu rubripes TaxID=31033 RepID=H2UD12_TAKRU|nr:protein-glutamine gamma-glutamyltransferase 5-like isoform X2 [Takifugu rubripes]|eukprot:XP_003973530.2 PREDICTED: protein-glutamine gamma-glutamyltransferase 5-like isoform X2 [Takifugu rubripes]
MEVDSYHSVAQNEIRETQMEELNIRHDSLEKSENLQRHRTEGFGSTAALVVRRGAPFRVTLQVEGRPFNPKTDTLRIKLSQGRNYMVMPVAYSKRVSSRRWQAYLELEGLDLRRPSVFISSPASASVGGYRFELFASKQGKWRRCLSGKFILLCNPWCPEDTVYIPFEDQREEYIQNDSGLLFMGTALNLVSRPWSFDQFEPGVLEACLNLLHVSPQHKKNPRRDYANRNNPVYLSRVVSAMINCEDDHGVLKGNWSNDFKEGVHPSTWSGSADILKKWAQSNYSPVKYGQCWVYAAVMCTVMRVLGIPCRVVTNFNSAHDTNGNLVIEEYYSETGKKLNHSKDSIWNFHVWVECWMERNDLGPEMNGWQVLDPTPQERSGGVFCCGPAPVRAIKDRRTDLFFDIPFVYAAVNADVHSIVVSKGRVVSHSKDTERVGAFICTKAVGYPRHQNITRDYKYITSPTSSLTRSSVVSDDSTLRRGSSSGIAVFLTLDKAPVAGEPIRFTVNAVNKQKVAKMMKVHLNAQAKEYNHSPSETFWETHGIIEMSPMESKVIKQQIFPAQYEDVVGDDLINLAVVLEDMATQERVLASEEFNITTSQLTIQVEDSVILNREQTATVTFSNHFSHPVSGILTVAGAGLIQGRVHYRMMVLPGGRAQQRITFLPRMTGTKMLQASLSLANINSTISGFKMVFVNKG